MVLVGKLFIIVFIFIVASANTVLYCTNEPSSKQRQLKELSELLFATQLLESQIGFNNKIITSMERNSSPILIDGFPSKAAFKRSENEKLRAELTQLKLNMSLAILKNQ